MTDDAVSKQAITFIKNHKKLLIEKFANDTICKREANPFSIFMAGSPGAGKQNFPKIFY